MPAGFPAVTHNSQIEDEFEFQFEFDYDFGAGWNVVL
jgi:hypothetical protein